MELNAMIRFGYVVMIVSILLMVWVSLTGGFEIDVSRHPPCYFNPLCSCSKAIPDLGIVRCSDVRLPRIPETINSSKIFMLHLENNGLRSIEPYFFQSTGLYKLTISGNPLFYIADEAFLGLERSLWVLDLSHNRLNAAPNKALRYLQKLRHLDLSGNDIAEILADNWRGLENSLEVLILSDNALNSLPTDAFSGLPLLDTIDLTGNNLRDIDPSVFRDGMGKLTRVLLSDNQLSSIPYQALQPLKLLKHLDLSNNQIDKMQPPIDPQNPEQEFTYSMSLDALMLDYNQISHLETDAFEYFDVLNKTYIDGNPLKYIEDGAFKETKIKELYIRGCGLTTIAPAAFAGLENYLQILDLSGNNLTALPETLFHNFQAIRTLSLEDNLITDLNPTETLTGFQYGLHRFDFSGSGNEKIAIQDLRRLRHLRALSLSTVKDPHLSPEDFEEYGRDLEELSVNMAGLTAVKDNAFQHVHSLRKLDLSENLLTSIEPNAFQDIGMSLVSLQLSHAFAGSVNVLPTDPLKTLVNLRELDVSNNRITTLPDISFHFLKRLRRLELQDNVIEQVFKGTFQGDIHSSLEEIYLSFNYITTIQQHTFVDLSSLEQLHLDDNRIEHLERRSFMNLENLKRLNLKGNDIATISYEAFQNLPELEDLDMSYNELDSFEFSAFDQVGTLAMLRVNASHNKITDLSVNFSFTFSHDSGSGGFHSNIKILDLSYNNITTISKQYFQPAMISISHLHLSHNGITHATRDVFGNMPHLQWLDLSHNELSEIDFDTFRNTKTLQVFFMSNNDITEVSHDLFRSLKNLRIVDFSHNDFRTLPENLFREEGLEYLDLSHNELNRLPFPSIGSMAAQSLCELDLSWNEISSIAHGEIFSKFKVLHWLDLSYNRLVQLDEGVFANLPRLTSLDLGHNTQLVLENARTFDGLEDSLLHLSLENVSLTYVPELPLPNLLSLSLAYNSLPTVPPEMATNLSSLQILNLAYNDLTAIPVVTHSLRQLRHLSLAENPVTFLSNTSLLGVAEHLEELDITNFDLNTLETGALSKMYALRSLKISIYDAVKNFNIPKLLEFNSGLRHLEIHVDHDDDNLGQIMTGVFPTKLKSVTLTGLGLTYLESTILEGIRSSELNFCLRNTSVTTIPADLFENVGFAKNLTVDVRDNEELRSLPKPFAGERPGDLQKPFLIDLWLAGSKWTCDCDVGWVEIWQRKQRQYLCEKGTPLSRNAPDFYCRHAEDDLRLAECINKRNQSFIEVLKNEIECGLTSSAAVDGFSLFNTIVLYFATYLI